MDYEEYLDYQDDPEAFAEWHAPEKPGDPHLRGVRLQVQGAREPREAVVLRQLRRQERAVLEPQATGTRSATLRAAGPGRRWSACPKGNPPGTRVTVESRSPKHGLTGPASRPRTNTVRGPRGVPDGTPTSKDTS